MARFQQTLASQASFEKHGRKSKRELFLDQMNQVVPWSEFWRWLSLFTPRLATAASRLVWRLCFGPTFCSSGSACLTRAWKKPSMSRPCCAASPEWILALPRRRTRRRSCVSATCLRSTICAARCWMTVNHYLETKGIRITTGTIVDATIIHAPSSTKNSSGERDPEMHQTKKGN
jgi:IS5 family transposase